LIKEIESGELVGSSPVMDAIMSRKLKLQRVRSFGKFFSSSPNIIFAFQERRLAGLPTAFMKDSYEGPVTILSLPRLPSVTTNSQVIDALYSIKTTPYEFSFLSRLSGVLQGQIPASGVLAVDWENVTPWMSLMNDIREHYSIAQYVFPIFKISDSDSCPQS
jgi:hypothetical protein